ncbi:hypothetical protein GCM10023178_02000 [Actinomadura luteofluorescens]
MWVLDPWVMGSPDRIIAARLQGAASRLAGQHPLAGKARAAAVAEVREIATVRPATRPGSVHQPTPVLCATCWPRSPVCCSVRRQRTNQRRIVRRRLLVEAGATRGLLDD